MASSSTPTICRSILDCRFEEKTILKKENNVSNEREIPIRVTRRVLDSMSLARHVISLEASLAVLCVYDHLGTTLGLSAHMEGDPSFSLTIAYTRRYWGRVYPPITSGSPARLVDDRAGDAGTCGTDHLGRLSPAASHPSSTVAGLNALYIRMFCTAHVPWLLTMSYGITFYYSLPTYPPIIRVCSAYGIYTEIGRGAMFFFVLTHTYMHT